MPLSLTLALSPHSHLTLKPSISTISTRERLSHRCLHMLANPSESSPLKEGASLWYNIDQMKSLSSITSVSIGDLHSHHIDVIYDPSSSSSIFRLRSQSRIHKVARDHISECQPISTQKASRAQSGAALTYRWCSNFVKHLNLCPWAKQSLSSENAIRVKVVDQKDGLDKMEQVVRESAIELKDLTDRGLVDPYIGISFVVSLPDCGTSGNDEEGFDFLSFNEYFNDLEEEFLDELVDGAGSYIGDEVTIAPFHPKWSFAPSDMDEDNENNYDETIEDPINYEKRTPFPTISIVMSKGIDLAGEETTARIGVHNEEILNQVGSIALKSLYHDKVLIDQ